MQFNCFYFGGEFYAVVDKTSNQITSTEIFSGFLRLDAGMYHIVTCLTVAGQR
jgi:hypothetical protein